MHLARSCTIDVCTLASLLALHTVWAAGNVLAFEERVLPALARGGAASLRAEAAGLLEQVAGHVGSKHWTSVRLSQIVAGIAAQAAVCEEG